MIRALTLAICLVAIAHSAMAQLPPAGRPDLTVQAVLPGCQSLVATKGVPTTTGAAFCSGMIDILLYVGEMLPADFCYAVPLDIPRHRVVQAIVEEIEAVYPAVRNHHFRALALEVLEYRWPCRY